MIATKNRSAKCLINLFSEATHQDDQKERENHHLKLPTKRGSKVGLNVVYAVAGTISAVSVSPEQRDRSRQSLFQMHNVLLRYSKAFQTQH